MPILQLLVPFAIMILKSVLKSKAHDEESRRDFEAFNEIMVKRGMASVKLRLNALNQVERVEDMWKEDGKK